MSKSGGDGHENLGLDACTFHSIIHNLCVLVAASYRRSADVSVRREEKRRGETLMFGSAPIEHCCIMWLSCALIIILAIGMGVFVLWQQSGFLEENYEWCDKTFGVGGWSWNATTACKDTSCAEQCVPIRYVIVTNISNRWNHSAKVNWSSFWW